MKIETNKQVGERVAEERNIRGWSQDYLAELLNWSAQGVISHYEKGRRKLSIEKIRELEKAFKLKPNDLLKSKTNSSLKSELVVIPKLLARPSMGGGELVIDDNDMVIGQVTIPRKYLEDEFCRHANLSDVRVIEGIGTSMLGKFNEGQPLIVDVSVQSYFSAGIYVFTLEGKIGTELYIKYLNHDPNGIYYTSHNTKAQPEPFRIAKEHDLRVKAKVLGAISYNDFHSD